MKTDKVINLFVILIFIFGFLLLYSLDVKEITGFSVKDIDSFEIDGEIDVIITLKDNSMYSEKDNIKSQQDKFVKLNDLEKENDYDNINAIAVKLDKDSLERIKKDSNVESITIDQMFKISLGSSKSVIGADLIWDKIFNGENLIGKGSVCVLDTGAYFSHANLGSVINGYDFVNDDSDASDDNGHGTHVSGIIVSDDSTNKGIAYGGNVLAVKVMNSGGSGSGSDIIAGIDWCINHRDEYNISVISMSIGSDTLFDEVCDDAYPELTSIINEAVLNGILVVSSSANDHSSTSLALPACISNCTSVGAVDDSSSVASFSNSANFLDMLATGVSITSTKNGGGFVSMSGTSMAAPHVSASVLLIKQYANLGVFDLKNVLISTGDDVLDGRNGLTFPRLNVFKALVSLDSFEPILSFDINDVYDDKEQNLYAEAEDTFLDSIWVEVDGANYSNGYVMNGLSINDEISFTFYANDSAGNLNSSSGNFVVLDGTPVLENIERLVGVVNKEFNYDVSASDPTEDVLDFSDDTELFDIDSGLISFTPSLEDAGNYTININVSDGYHLVSDEFVLEILANNTAPSIVDYNPDSLNAEINENESLEFSVVGYDADNTSLDYNWYLDSSLVSESDSYNFVSDYSSSGEYNITIVVSDGIESDSLKWGLAVNDVDLVPVYLGGIDDMSFDENTNYSLNLSDNFADLDGDDLSYNISITENMSFDGEKLIPKSDFVGLEEVQFYGCDSAENCGESSLIDILVNNVVVCGDGVREGAEKCDLSDLNGKTCLDFDYNSGSLSCDADCRFDYTGCVISSSGGGGTPSGGGGTPIKNDFDEGIQVEEKSEEVEQEVKAGEEKKGEEVFTGSGIKEMKPKSSRFRRLWEAIKDFFRSIFRWIFDLF